MPPETPHLSPTRLVLSSLTLFLSSYWTIILPILLLLHLLRNRYLSPLRHIPGPILASTTRLYKALSVFTGATNHHRLQLHRAYGPLVRLTPNEISLASPTAAREVLAAGKGFTKTAFYSVFPPPENPDIFTEVRESLHAQKKKVAAIPYSMASMQKLSPFIDDTIDLFVHKMDNFARTGGGVGQVDLGNWLHYFAFDVLGAVAFSHAFGFLEQGRDVEGAIKTIDDMQWYNGLIGQIPELDFVLRRNPVWKLWTKVIGQEPLIARLAKGELERRKPFEKDTKKKWGGDERQDLLASLIQGHLKNPERFSEADVFSVSHGAIFAGSDSTASTMQSFFHEVLSHPEVHHKLITEISAAASSGRIPSHGNLTWTHAQSLPYFQACLKEAMRLRPAVGLDITRIVPPGGAVLGGQFVPGGTQVAVNGWVVQRDEGIFGDEVDRFRPDRWLAAEETTKVMERYMCQFGGGAHVCIGRNLALLEMNKILLRLLRDYSFSLIREGPLRATATFFVVQNGLELLVDKKTPTDDSMSWT